MGCHRPSARPAPRRHRSRQPARGLRLPRAPGLRLGRRPGSEIGAPLSGYNVFHRLVVRDDVLFKGADVRVGAGQLATRLAVPTTAPATFSARRPTSFSGGEEPPLARPPSSGRKRRLASETLSSLGGAAAGGGLAAGMGGCRTADGRDPMPGPQQGQRNPHKDPGHRAAAPKPLPSFLAPQSP